MGNRRRSSSKLSSGLHVGAVSLAIYLAGVLANPGATAANVDPIAALITANSTAKTKTVKAKTPTAQKSDQAKNQKEPCKQEKRRHYKSFQTPKQSPQLPKSQPPRRNHPLPCRQLPQGTRCAVWQARASTPHSSRYKRQHAAGPHQKCFDRGPRQSACPCATSSGILA